MGATYRDSGFAALRESDPEIASVVPDEPARPRGRPRLIAGPDPRSAARPDPLADLAGQVCALVGRVPAHPAP